VELHQRTRAEASGDNDDQCAEEKDDVHCVLLLDRETEASCYNPGQEDRIGVADHRRYASGENASRSMEAELDLFFRHSRPGSSCDVADTVEAARQNDYKDERVSDGEANAYPDGGSPPSFEEIFHHAAEEQ